MSLHDFKMPNLNDKIKAVAEKVEEVLSKKDIEDEKIIKKQSKKK